MINERDPCVFNMADEDGKIIASVFIHVDDGYLSCVNDEIVTRFKSQLEQIFTHGITWKEGKFHEYLGMVMDFSTPGKCYLTMKDYKFYKFSVRLKPLASRVSANIYHLCMYVYI